MYAEKRKLRIGDGIDQRPHQRRTLGDEMVVLTAKGNDSYIHYIGRCAGHSGDAVAEQSGTVDEIRGGEYRAAGFHHDFTGEIAHAGDSGGSQNRSTLGADQLGIFLANGGEIGDARGGHDQRAQTAGVRLDFVQLIGTDKAETRESVGLAPAPQFFQARNFLCARGYDDFAADLVRQAMRAAEFDHGARALDAELRFQRSGLVINAGVNDAAVVAALMPAHAVFFLEQQQAKAGESLRDLKGDGETDNTSADDEDIVAGVGHER